MDSAAHPQTEDTTMASGLADYECNECGIHFEADEVLDIPPFGEGAELRRNGERVGSCDGADDDCVAICATCEEYDGQEEG
jgi:hypothetical protein